MTRSDPSTLQRLRPLARRIFAAALRAADPDPLVRRFLSLDRRTVAVDGTPFTLGAAGRVLVLAAGKAAAPMARAAEQCLGPLVGSGLAVVKDGHGLDLERVQVVEAGHPVPDRHSVNAAERMLRMAASADGNDLLLCLLSGGASALLAAPAPPLTLDDLRRTTGLLLRSGAGIGRINCVRKHLSAIKGGLLARAARPAALATLLLSDVVGDRPEVIASGPTVPDRSLFGEALAILDTPGLRGSVPPAVLQRLRSGAAGEIGETPGPVDPCFRQSVTRVVGSNRDALLGAAAEAADLGCRVEVLPEPVTGEAVVAASLICRPALLATTAGMHRPVCFISGGETTVTLPAHHGLGGRNMELALAAAPLLAECPVALLLSAGTDGSDGPSGAAGAMVDSSSLVRAGQQGLDHRTSLERHDAYPFFQALDDLVVTGPTRTNVMDLQILLLDPLPRKQSTLS